MRTGKGGLCMTYKFDEFLDRLKEIKTEKQLRVEDISRLSNVPLGTVSKIFAGITTDPKISTVISIAESLDVSIDYLIYGKRETHVEESSLVNKYRQLEADEQEEIEAIIDLKIDKLNKKIQEKEETA